MKKSILGALVVVLGTSFAASAQMHTRVGVKGGLNLSHNQIWQKAPLIETVENNGFGPGFYLGGLLEVSGKNKSSKLKGQIELQYNYHTMVNNDVAKFSTRLHVLNIPVSVKYFFQPHMSLIAGINNNINLSGTFKNKTIDVVNDITNLNTYQPGAHVGFNYYFKKGLFLDLRYNYNFGSTLDMPYDGYFRYGHGQVGIGYKF